MAQQRRPSAPPRPSRGRTQPAAGQPLTPPVPHLGRAGSARVHPTATPSATAPVGGEHRISFGMIVVSLPVALSFGQMLIDKNFSALPQTVGWTAVVVVYHTVTAPGVARGFFDWMGDSVNLGPEIRERLGIPAVLPKVAAKPRTRGVLGWFDGLGADVQNIRAAMAARRGEPVEPVALRKPTEVPHHLVPVRSPPPPVLPTAAPPDDLLAGLLAQAGTPTPLPALPQDTDLSAVSPGRAARLAAILERQGAAPVQSVPSASQSGKNGMGVSVSVSDVQDTDTDTGGIATESHMRVTPGNGGPMVRIDVHARAEAAPASGRHRPRGRGLDMHRRPRLCCRGRRPLPIGLSLPWAAPARPRTGHLAP